ncbi:MAG TPA: hypothetical protein DCL76_06605 [Chloroflexi bacterium]|nr:hypothetical protein [Chloroflexota bacterium]HCU99134.1 hypothetical protein [Chloroflexota bacterium]|tara:strand:+ start:314 stop:1666 length:1353 start_codon:yes stop_codon:yes gene_type:complete
MNIYNNTSINCPNCNQRISAEITQILDVSIDNNVKQQVLQKNINIINCPVCSYRGMASTPIVYHDPEKELLLTYTPLEINIPLPEKEKLLGKLTRQIVDKIPVEQRKAYLLQPKEMMSYEALTTIILNNDGITNEMIEQQKQKMSLLQTLMSTETDKLPEIIKENDNQIDELFFHIFTTIKNTNTSQHSETLASSMNELEHNLLLHSSVGKESQSYAQALQQSAKDLEDLGENITRDSFLDLILKAKDDMQIRCLLSLARPAADYEFFLILSKRIDNSKEAEKDRLEHIRSLILETIQKIDKATAEKAASTESFLNSILESSDSNEFIQSNIDRVDQSLLLYLQQLINEANKNKDKQKEKQLTDLHEIILQAVHQNSPPEIQFINELLSTPTDNDGEKLLKEKSNLINSELLETMKNAEKQLINDSQTNLASKLSKYITLAENIHNQTNK